MRAEERAASGARIAVLGAPRVGKSALIVRYLTRRYIGEYQPDTDLLYRQTVSLPSGPLDIEVLEVSGTSSDQFPVDQIQWADACLVVYSVTDRASFQYAEEAVAAVRTATSASPASSSSASTSSATPASSTTGNTTTAAAGLTPSTSGMAVAVLANKVDLDHLRQVTTNEGRMMANKHSAAFTEASVADNSTDLYRSFERLLIDGCRGTRARKFSVSRVLGALGAGRGGARRGGSVVACPRPPAPPVHSVHPTHSTTLLASP